MTRTRTERQYRKRGSVLAGLASVALCAATGCSESATTIDGTDSTPCTTADRRADSSETSSFEFGGGSGDMNYGLGGNGGGLRSLIHFGGSGSIEILASGAVDASFTPTTDVDIDLGSNSLWVVADLAVEIASTEPAAGTVYAVAGDHNLYVSDGDGTLADEAPVTGIETEAGARLTLPVNQVDHASFSFSADIVNVGTITVDDLDSTARGGIALTAGGMYLGSGNLETYGTEEGQSGGDITLIVAESFYSAGSMVSYGADHSTGDGGDGGALLLQINPLGGRIENQGAWDSHGGAATGASGTGGTGGTITWNGYLDVSNVGDLETTGGAGPDNGGDGGVIDIENYRGNIVNAGDVHASGGDSDGADGGDAQIVEFLAFGGLLASSGDVTANGGSSQGASGDGGEGALLGYSTYPSDDTYEPTAVDASAGSIFMSGTREKRGGDATGSGAGGSAGHVAFEVNNSVSEGDQSICLYGYEELAAAGGEGYEGGTNEGVSIDLNYQGGAATGSIILEARLDVSGGDADRDASGSMGGDGAEVSLVGGTIEHAEIDVDRGIGDTPGASGTVKTGS